jgi:hypothetical protein
MMSLGQKLKHEQHEYLGILQENQGEMMVVSSQKEEGFVLQWV